MEEASAHLLMFGNSEMGDSHTARERSGTKRVPPCWPGDLGMYNGKPGCLGGGNPVLDHDDAVETSPPEQRLRFCLAECEGGAGPVLLLHLLS